MTGHENDFFRPLGNRTAVVNGKHSNLCYLDAMEGAFHEYLGKAGKEKADGALPGVCSADDR